MSGVRCMRGSHPYRFDRVENTTTGENDGVLRGCGYRVLVGSYVGVFCRYAVMVGLGRVVRSWWVLSRGSSACALWRWLHPGGHDG